MTTRPPVAPPLQIGDPETRDDQPAILYSSIVFLFAVAVLWNLPVSFIPFTQSGTTRRAENARRLQVIRAVINPLKVSRLSIVFH